MFKGKHNLLQASMYVEHRAKLAVLKCAVDYICSVRNGDIVEPTLQQLITDLYQPNIISLPSTFRKGVEWLGQRPNVLLYPRFWQTFLWAWGGFILMDRQDEEFAELSRQTGVPLSEVPDALQAFDKLFPMPDTWFGKPAQTNFQLLKMMPVHFRGIGAFHRLNLYKAKTHDDLGYTDYTGSDLRKWQNATAQLLQP
jgi:hypothetical protein